jgi:hypothetical protein
VLRGFGQLGYLAYGLLNSVRLERLHFELNTPGFGYRALFTASLEPSDLSAVLLGGRPAVSSITILPEEPRGLCSREDCNV